MFGLTGEALANRVRAPATSATARALTEIRPVDPTGTTPVFGLTGEALANRVRAPATSAAGLGDGFTGHSGRIGMARRMVAAGAPNAAVQNQGRWKHGDMVARYTRGESAGEARWSDLQREENGSARLRIPLSQNWTILELVTWFTSHQKRLPPYTRCGTKTRTRA